MAFYEHSTASEAPRTVPPPAEMPPASTPTEQPDQPLIVIQPTRGWRALHLREIWRSRDLLYILSWRDISVRYKQAALGIIWAVFNPLMMTLVYTIIFSKLAKFQTENNIPYPVFLYSAMLAWNFFSTGVTRSGASLINNSNLISKIFFPRLIIPLAALFALSLDFIISFGVLLGLMVFYHVKPTLALLAFPVLIIFLFLATLALSLWVAAISVRHRDAQHLLPFLLQIMLYASPIMYSPDMIYNPTIRFLYNFNPLYGLVQGFRWSLAQGNPPPLLATATSVIVILVALASGLYYFTRVERILADLV